jgi:hypothetical protein
MFQSGGLRLSQVLVLLLEHLIKPHVLVRNYRLCLVSAYIDMMMQNTGYIHLTDQIQDMLPFSFRIFGMMSKT